MDTYAKDIFNVGFWLVASIGGIITAVLAIREARKQTQQRKDELRLNQAKFAMEVIDRLRTNKKIVNAVEMADVDGLEFEIIKGQKKEVISSERMLVGLRSKENDKDDILKLDSIDLFIRRSFDALFLEFERLEIFLTTEVINFKDIEPPLRYDVENLSEHKETIASYLNTFNFPLVLNFLKRFESWNQTAL